MYDIDRKKFGREQSTIVDKQGYSLQCTERYCISKGDYFTKVLP